MATIEEYNKLKELVLHHRRIYELENRVEITDSEYDALYFQLKKMEEEHPQWVTSDSPTQTVAQTDNKLPKVKHKFALKSLDKVQHDHLEELKAFIDKFATLATDKLLVENKEDGLTICTNYNVYTKPFVASTRGNGVEGEDVTASIQNLAIPKELTTEDGSIIKDEVIIRSEAVITYKDFDAVNIEGKYQSPRNLVSGSVRTNDSLIASKRGVKLLAYNIENALELGLTTEEEMLQQLKKWGYEVSEPTFFENTVAGRKELLKYVARYEEKYRNNLDHMIDGLVIKPNSLTIRAKMGDTSHHPKWAMAYKFESEDAITKVLDIYWTVGKTGMIVPNALVEPVEISDSIIERASLANINNIKKRDIRVGDWVNIIRSNDVIPQIVSSIKEKREDYSEEVTIPEVCPSCGAKVSIQQSVVDGEELLVPYCVNEDCSAQQLRKLENFVSKQALNIDSMAGKTLETLYEEGLVKNFSDIYVLKDHEAELLALPRFGKKKVEKLLANIESSKDRGLYAVLIGLSIKNIGKDVSKKLSQQFGSFENLYNAFEEDAVKFKEELLLEDGFGETIVATIISTLSNQKVLNELSLLQSLGVSLTNTLEEVKVSTVDSNITGKTFVITGTLSRSRSEIAKDIEALGGKVVGSVSKNTDYLLMGSGADGTSKHKKALALGVKIVGEEILGGK